MPSDLRRRGIPVHEKGAPLGVAELDGSGYVPMAQLPAAVVDGLTPRGGWDASGSTYPTPTNIGDFWWITVAGTLGGVDYEIDDWLVYVDDSPVTWDKIDNTDKVTSIFGRTGAVVAVASDYDASQVDNDSVVGGAFVKDALDAIAVGGIGKEVYVDPTTGNDANNGKALFPYATLGKAITTHCQSAGSVTIFLEPGSDFTSEGQQTIDAAMVTIRSAGSPLMGSALPGFLIRNNAILAIIDCYVFATIKTVAANEANSLYLKHVLLLAALDGNLSGLIGTLNLFGVSIPGAVGAPPANWSGYYLRSGKLMTKGMDAGGVAITSVADPSAPQEADTQAARDAAITTHAGVASAHHARYTDGEAATVAAVGIAAHTSIPAAHHTKYTDPEAVTAMGVKDDGNPLNHDRPVDFAGAGANGLVPDPTAEAGKVLSDNGAWVAVDVPNNKFAKSDALSTHTGNTAFQTKASVVLDVDGTYDIIACAQLGGSSTGDEYQTELHDGASQLDVHSMVPYKQYNVGAGLNHFPKCTLIAQVVRSGSNVTVSLRYATTNAAKTVAIQNARITARKVS